MQAADGKMGFEDFSFGSIRIDGVTHKHDVVIDRGTIRKRKKKPSRKFRDEFGHTPLSVEKLKLPSMPHSVVGAASILRAPRLRRPFQQGRF